MELGLMTLLFFLSICWMAARRAAYEAWHFFAGADTGEAFAEAGGI